MMTTNLPSGYHRDLQLLKENLFPAFGILHDCMDMAALMFENISIKKDILQDSKYQYLFSVEEVNKLVLQGMPFRDAYKNIGAAIEQGLFKYDISVQHVHEGSIGNLQNDAIAQSLQNTIAAFNFDKVNTAFNRLIQ